MSKLHDFLNEAGIFYLATADDDQPKVRPLGAHVEEDGKEYFTVGDFKEVYRQMVKNPRVEIVAFEPKTRRWLRYTGKVVFVDSPSVEEKIFQELPHLRQMYNDETGYKMKIFTLEDATAKILDMQGNVEELELK